MNNVFSFQNMLVQKYLYRDRGRFCCIFFDFKRVFDSIQHTNLWNSLDRNGIKQDGKCLMIFKSWYFQLKSCVKVKHGLLQFLKDIGTRQGCVSSPIFFLYL